MKVWKVDFFAVKLVVDKQEVGRPILTARFSSNGFLVRFFATAGVFHSTVWNVVAKHEHTLHGKTKTIVRVETQSKITAQKNGRKKN